MKEDNSIIIKGFAPIVIPTLCRFEHFKRCIESLMECTFSDKTDVYIGLDYPINESHLIGYNKISNYLQSIANTHTFKSLNVVRRNQNLGFGKNGNLETLIREIFTFSDRVIVSEDDNIFAPSFLDFINKGLTIFANDRSVIAINGYRHFYSIKIENNTFFRQNVDFSAWGFGIWKDRYDLFYNYSSNSKAHILDSLKPQTWIRLVRNGLNRTLGFISILRKGYCEFTDNSLSVFMGIKNMDVIMPVKTLVKNEGWDNSGEHCKDNLDLAFLHNNQILYENQIFNFVGSGFEHYNQNKKIYRTQSYGKVSYLSLFKKIINKVLNIGK
ncbi:MAG: glycosyl transferase [Muribaculum sp.]|nr:glycosyl transferase [Muribaculum sp.]